MWFQQVIFWHHKYTVLHHNSSSNDPLNLKSSQIFSQKHLRNGENVPQLVQNNHYRTKDPWTRSPAPVPREGSCSSGQVSRVRWGCATQLGHQLLSQSLNCPKTRKPQPEKTKWVTPPEIYQVRCRCVNRIIIQDMDGKRTDNERYAFWIPYKHRLAQELDAAGPECIMTSSIHAFLLSSGVERRLDVKMGQCCDKGPSINLNLGCFEVLLRRCTWKCG